MTDASGERTRGLYAGRTRDQRRAERRVRLVDAGIEVIGTRGHGGATVRAICRAAGLTERYFYESFADREALLSAVYLHLVEALRERVTAAVAPLVADESALRDDAVRAGVRAFFTALRDDPRVARIVLFEAVNISASLTELNRAVEAQFVTNLRTAAHRHDPRGRLSEEQEALVAAGLFGAGVNIAMRWFLDDYRQPLEEVVESTVLIYQGVSSRIWAET